MTLSLANGAYRMLFKRTNFPVLIAVLSLACAPAIGAQVRYEIQFDGVTDVNNFSEAFSSFQVEFLIETSEPLDNTTYHWLEGAVSDFSVIQGEDVIFRTDNGDLQWWNGTLEIHAGDAEHFLGNALLLVELDDIVANGSFNNQLQEFRVPGAGGSIAWTVNGTVTQTPEPSAFGLAGFSSLTALLIRRRRAQRIRDASRLVV